MTDESGRAVRIEPTFDAPAEEVFDAWTSPEVMRRWFHCAPDRDTPEAEVDLRVRGKVRVMMRRADGTEVEARGEYMLIDRPHRLVMTAGERFGDIPIAADEASELRTRGLGAGAAAPILHMQPGDSARRRDSPAIGEARARCRGGHKPCPTRREVATAGLPADLARRHSKTTARFVPNRAVGRKRAQRIPGAVGDAGGCDNAPMVARRWTALAEGSERGDAYVEHFEGAVRPHLDRTDGFLGATVERVEADDGIEIVVVTRWESMDAIRAFAGQNIDLAVHSAVICARC